MILIVENGYWMHQPWHQLNVCLHRKWKLYKINITVPSHPQQKFYERKFRSERGKSEGKSETRSFIYFYANRFLSFPSFFSSPLYSKRFSIINPDFAYRWSYTMLRLMFVCEKVREFFFAIFLKAFQCETEIKPGRLFIIFILNAKILSLHNCAVLTSLLRKRYIAVAGFIDW